MMEINNILQHLFKKPSLEEVPLASLQDMVARHPYFAAGHFLLSKKLKQENDSAFTAQLEKTNLYFYNTLWLHFSLEEQKQQNDGSLSQLAGADPKEETTVSGHEEAPPHEIEELPSGLIDNSVTEAEMLPPQENNETYSPTEDREATADAGKSVTAAHETASGQTTDAQTEAPETNDRDATGGQNVSGTAEEPLLPSAKEREKAPAEVPLSFTKSFRAVESKEELAFDPYHTIDYFASLGIRLSQDPKPDDKLGRQLKSFTAWLKTMRRLPEITEDTVEVNQADLNAHIEKIASHSLLDKEVITQAMAEVLVMQGNREKAAEIYRKLSLLNPDKSAYFAARIEELKQN